MKERSPRNGPDTEPYLSNKTRAFIQHAFASGAAEKLPEIIHKRNMLWNSLLRRRYDEQLKWLLARYAADDRLSLNEVKKYAGVKSSQGARGLWIEGLNYLWEASPIDIQRKFPRQEVIVGKRPGRRRGDIVSEETRTRISRAKKGKPPSDEHRTKISNTLRERYKQERETKNQALPLQSKGN
jgi:hypothetical protein